MRKEESYDKQRIIMEGIPKFTMLLLFHPLAFWLIFRLQPDFLLLLLKGRASAYCGNGLGWFYFIKYLWDSEKVENKTKEFNNT